MGAYLVVLPRPEHLQYTLWIYSPLPGRQSIFYICDLSTDIHETLRMASTLCFYSPRSLLLVEYNAKRMQSKGDDIISVGSTTLQTTLPAAQQFQSTLPARGATPVPLLSLVSALDFNPRSPHGERRKLNSSKSCKRDFNPRSPHGERQSQSHDARCTSNFNPRSPHGERLPALVQAFPPADFNPRSPHGERRFLIWVY